MISRSVSSSPASGSGLMARSLEPVSDSVIMNFPELLCRNRKVHRTSFFFFNVYLFLRQRETEHEQGRGREREGDTESEAGSRL